MQIKIVNDLFIRHNKIDESKQSIWLLHGFGDSGLAYKEVFDSPLTDMLNVYVVDLPGFGASPINSNYLSIKAQSKLLKGVIEALSGDKQKINVVAHSIGGLIGTWVCQNLEGRIHYYFNIEGNLTEADSYFSSKPLSFDSADDFAQSFIHEIFEKAWDNESYRRYYSSLRFANPEAMRNWSLTSQEHIKSNQCGEEFKSLSCQKLYIWGDLDTSHESQLFIENHNIPNRLYEGVGHWHMIENADELYRDIHETLLLQ